MNPITPTLPQTPTLTLSPALTLTLTPTPNPSPNPYPLMTRSLLARVQRQWQLLSAAASYLPPTREAEEAAALYSQLDGSLDEYIRKMYSEWIATISPEAGRLLENYLMVTSNPNRNP